MQTNPFVRSLRWIIPVAALLTPSVRAEEPPLRELLRDGLYAEEVTRDPEAAAKQYEQVLARYSEQRAFAASALFRLAEVRRKQDRKEDAIQLYQRLLTEFPNAETETKLARENIAALGGKTPEAGKVVTNAEDEELARLQGMAGSAPDILLNPNTLNHAVNNGWTSVVNFLLAKGSQPYAGTNLALAVERGNLEIVKLLTDQPTKVPDAVAADAIWAAINAERYTILEYLLQKGFKPGKVDIGYGKIPTFIRAVEEGKLRGAEILLNHGADINVMADAEPQADFFPVGTALHFVIQNGTFDSVKWLLEKGAKPDLPDPTYGLSPLHFAVRRGDTAIMEILLAAGADPNRRSKDVSLPNNLMGGSLMNSTPLEAVAVVWPINLELVKLLLRHGANPNLEGSKIGKALAYAMDRDMERALEMVKVFGDSGFRMTDPVLLRIALQNKDWNTIELLLKYGANPNSHGSLLARACADGEPARIALLLKAGADVNEMIDKKGLIRLAVEGKTAERALPTVKILMDAGAKPEEGWKKDGYRDAPTPIREILLEKFTIPELGKESEITLLIVTGDSLQTLSIATRTGDSTMPDLVPWLLAHHTEIKQLPSDDGMMLHWAIWRKGENGSWAKQEIDLKTSEALPELRWGDVVTCSVEIPERAAPRGSVLPPPINRLPASELWHLRKRISFPITVETGGKSREIQVRGDRLFFDPTKDEVPLADAQDIADYVWQNDGITRNPRVTLIVSRKDWPDIRLSGGSKEAGKFRLEAGDRVKLEIPAQVSEDIAKSRRQFVTLKVEGYPFDKLLGVSVEGKPVEASIPTLIQALVDAQVPLSSNWMGFAKEKAVDLVKIYGVDALYRFTLLPHPDLSNIRIRRLMENGSEKVIEVNLAKVIAAGADLTTADEARKADVLLQPGDVVEISLLKDQLDAPWKGFNMQEQAFFTKALGGRVQVTDEQGAITLRDLPYKAPRFIETETGWVPLPPESGMPSARGSWLTRDDWMNVKRGEVQSGGQYPSTLFLRDRDEILINGVDTSSRDPRPRVVPQPQPQPRPPVLPPSQ